AVFQAEVFAVAGRVLADQGNFANAGLRQSLCFGDDRGKTPGAELAAQLRNNAESAGMITALGDLDISRVARCSQNSRCRLIVEIIGQVGDCTVPGFARESSL